MGKMKAAAAAAEETSPAFVVPGLTRLQREARSKGIGGSDAERIMSGDWYQLWAEKTGRLQPEDLSRVLPVQMGLATEAFNAYWFHLQSGLQVNRAPSVIERCHVHPAYPQMLCNIDGLVIIDGRLRLFEAKHVNPFGSKGDQPAKHYAQIQHCLEVLDLEGCELSVFFGSMDWSRFSIERDKDYGALLIDREREFWEHVQSDKPPERNEVGEETPKFDLMRQLNMRRDNKWGDGEATWVSTREHVKLGDAAESALKGMMPGDCDFAFGHELCCVRDRAGKLTLRYPNKKDALRIEELLESERLALQREDEEAFAL
jgi:hypothetical protein